MKASPYDNTSSRSIRQKTCIDNWVKNKCRGTAVLPTGFGKTNVGLIAIERFLNKNPNKKVLVVVPNDPIKLQWEGELSNRNLNAEVQTMYVTSHMTFVCDLLIIDEVHKIAAPTLYSTFENVTYKIILGLTATFERLDGRDMLLSKHAPVIDEVTVAEAIENNWLNDYREYLVLIEPDDIEEYNKINKEFLEHFSYFDYNFNTAMKMATDWKARANLARQKCSGDNFKDINKQILIHAMGFSRTLQARKKYINNHPKKIELTNLILENRQDKKRITFSATIAMAEKIKYGKVYSGKDSTKKGRTTLYEFINQDRGVVNSIAKLNEGFNDPSLSVAIILGMNSSKTVKKQRLGRLLRHQDGKIVEVFNLVLKGTVEEQWFYNSVGSDKYLTIDEDNLNFVLNGKLPSIKKNKETKMLFRF